MTRPPARPAEVELAGTDDLGAIIERTRRQLREAIAVDLKAGKTPRQTTREVRINARWGWTFWQVDEHGGYSLVEVAVARPGTGRNHRTLMLANADNAGWMRTLGGAGGAGLGAIGGLAGFAVTTPALLIAGAGGALGVGAAVWARRRLNRWVDDSVRLRDGILTRLSVTRAARQMNLIDFKIRDFHAHMAAVAADHGTDPVPLPLTDSRDFILDEIHQAVWDLASEQSSDTAGKVLAELQRIGREIDAAVATAWSTWHAARVEIPPDPALSRPTVARLRRLSGSVQDSHTASLSAANDVRRINHPD